MKSYLRIVKGLIVAGYLLVMTAVVLAAAPMTIGGTVKSVAASGKSIVVTIGSGGSAKSESFGVTASTKVTLDDKNAKVSELKPGTKVTISYDKSSKDAASIKAHSTTNESSNPDTSDTAKTAANSKDAPPPAWTMDLAKMQIPDAPVAGKIHGQPFKLEKVQLQGNVLELRQGKDFFPDLALNIFLTVKDGESLEGKTIRVTNKDGFRSPQIHKQYRAKPGEGLPETEFITEKYAMLLQFGKAQNGALVGKIFVSLPDKAQSFIAGTFTLSGADGGAGATASLISGKIEYRGTERKFDAFVGCLGKNSEGKLESPGAGFPVSLDEPSGSATCLTWEPRNTTLAWDKKTGLTHKSVNRTAGHYLVFVKKDVGDKNDNAFFDWKWIELKDDSSKVTVDLSIDPATLGSVEVSVVGKVAKDAAINCLPLDANGESPLPDALNWAPFKAKIENGRAVLGKIRKGKYQFGYFGATAVAEVKAGATTKVELIVPKTNPTPSASLAPATTSSLISGKIMYRGPEREFTPQLFCLGKNAEGRLEAPGVGLAVAVDGESTSSTNQPRNTALAWDKQTGLTHRSINRPAGHYLIYARVFLRDSDEFLYDGQWVELKDDKSKVTVDLNIDPSKWGQWKSLCRATPNGVQSFVVFRWMQLVGCRFRRCRVMPARGLAVLFPILATR